MIARNTFVIMLSQATCAALGMFGLFAISKLWGEHAPGIMGVVWFGFSFVGSFSFITNLGFDAAHVKKISEGRDLGKCNGTYIAIKLMLTGAFAASVLASVLLWKNFAQGSFHDSTREWVLYIFIGYYILFSLAQIPIMTFNSLKKNAKSQTSILMESTFRIMLFVIIATAGISGALIASDAGTRIVDLQPAYSWPSALENVRYFISTHVIGVMSLAYTVGAAAMLVTGIFLFRKFPVSRPDREHMSLYLSFALPMMVPVIFSLLNTYLDKVILGYYWTTVEVGYYFAVQRISTFVMLIPSAIGAVLFPTISFMHSRSRSGRERRNRKIVRLTRISERYISMVTVPIILTFIVLAVPLIDIILNSSFRPGTLSMQILTLNTYVAALYVPFYFVVLGTDRPGIIAKAFMVSGLSNIALNLLLVPRDGLLASVGLNGPAGAATATLVSATIMFAFIHHYASTIMRRKLFDSRVLLHILAGLMAGLLVWFLAGMLDPIRWYHMAALSLAGLGAYLGVLYALGEFRKPELRFFLDTMNPVMLLRYVNSEVREKGDGKS